jgi:hypothetical protein
MVRKLGRKSGGGGIWAAMQSPVSWKPSEAQLREKAEKEQREAEEQRRWEDFYRELEEARKQRELEFEENRRIFDEQLLARAEAEKERLARLPVKKTLRTFKNPNTPALFGGPTTEQLTNATRAQTGVLGLPIGPVRSLVYDVLAPTAKEKTALF